MSKEVSVQDNSQAIHSNATITSSGSTSLFGYGFQQIALVVNIKAAPTGTTPTLTYTIQEVDPGDGATTFGNSSSTAALNSTGVYTATLNTTTSGYIKISWVIAGASASFTQVYATVVAKATPSSQAVSASPANTTAGISFGDVALSSITSNIAVNRTTYTEQTTNFTGSVKSASANDTTGGTGAKTVTIVYYDQTGAGPYTETVSMNGTTAVNLVNTNHCYIESIAVATVGTGGSNAGIISLFTGAGGTGTTVGTIAAGDNKTYWAHHYVPSGKTNNLTSMSVTVNGGAGQFFIRALAIGVTNAVELQITDIVRSAAQAATTPRNYGTPIKTTGPARLQGYVTTEANTSLTYRLAFDYYDQ